MKKALHIAVVAAFLAGIGFSAPAMADAKSDIKERKAAMKASSKATKSLKKLIADPAMNKAAIVKVAKALVSIANKNDKLFTKGSGMAAGKTRAKDEIWTNMAGFKKANATFRKAASALLETAEVGDAAGMNKAHGAVGKSCGGCHKQFRGKKI
jgi:cytochrome c556